MVSLHQKVSHSALDTLFSLLKFARPWETNQETTQVLALILTRFDACQESTNASAWFIVLLPSKVNLTFGVALLIDLMLLDWEVRLRIADTAALFLVACFLDHAGEHFFMFMRAIWLAFLFIRCTVYTRYPNRMGTDKWSVSPSERWKRSTDLTVF